MSRSTRTNPIALALLLWAGLSCNDVTAPVTTGGIRIRIVSAQTATAVAAGDEAAYANSDLYPIDAPTLSILLDSVRVSVAGQANKSQTATAPTGGTFNLTIGDLPEGSYTVTVVGFSGNRVAHYGQTTATVTAGQDTDANVAFPDFQPDPPNPGVVDSVEVLRFTVSWPAVANAASYVVEVSTSPTLATATSTPSNGTTIEITVPAENQYYYAIRAVNPSAPTGGLRSVIKSVVVLHSVGSVTLTPPTPSIVDGSTQQFTAVTRDLDNNTMSNVTLFWSSSNHSVATVSQTGLVTAVGTGQALITASAKGTPGSAALTVTPQSATKLVFTTPPGTTTAGQSIAPIAVSVQNGKNQTLTADNTTQVTVAIGANPGSGTLSGTATATVVNGVATFNNLSINRTGTGYTLTATAASLTTGTSAGFNVTSGAASQLAWVVQPTATTAGASFSPALQVEVRDALGNRVTTSRDLVTISIENDPVGGTLGGTLQVQAIDGIASFSGLSLNLAASGYTLRASASGLTQGVSTAFTINPAALAGLAFGTQPVNSSTDNNVVVSVRAVDRFGNLVSQAVPVTLSIGANPGAGTLSGTVAQSTTAGTATFNDLRIDKVGTGYTLQAQSGTLTTGTSASFNMTFGAPAKLAFTGGPDETVEPSATNTIEVSVQDAGGNQTDAAVNVTLALGVNPGTANLGGVLNTVSVAGVATFADITVDSTGFGYAIDATGGGLTTARSAAFDVVLEFTQVQTGGLHTCALTTRGSAYCWGWQAVASVGNGEPGGNFSRILPTRVAGPSTFFMIRTGDAHACALRTTDSTAVCWGWNEDGQAGIGATSIGVPAPTGVAGGHKFFTISAGHRHTCGLRVTDSLAFCWGQQSFGRLGNNQTGAAFVTAPVAVNSADRFSSISAGVEHTCAVRNDGTGFCWGRQLNGRLGNGQTLEASIGNPTAIGGLTFQQISAGPAHSCGVLAPASDSRGFCWGANGSGQLGFTGAETGFPTEVAKALTYASMQTGGRLTDPITCGLTSSSTVFCWGSASQGGLGNGVSTGTFDSPQAVLSGLSFLGMDAATASQGGGPNLAAHGCGLTPSGVYCWGNNIASGGNGGMLGDGTMLSASVLIKVKGQR